MLARSFGYLTLALGLAVATEATASPLAVSDQADTPVRQPTLNSFPTRGWALAPAARTADLMATPECREFNRFLLSPAAKDDDQGLKTDSLIVVREGQIVFERYLGSTTAETTHAIWSASKAVTSTLVGTAVQQGLVALEDRLTRWFPGTLRSLTEPRWARANYAQISIHHLLTMGAGFDWNETYEAGISTSSVLPMLYTRGIDDMPLYAARAPMRPEGPGRYFVYSGGNSNLLMAVLRGVYRQDYEIMPWRNLFDRLGMRGVVFERDTAGNFVGSSYVHLSLRDFAKLGYLYLKDGVWDGVRLLPEGWVRMSLSVSPAQLSPLTPLDEIRREGVFGAGFWLNRPVRELPRPFPSAPEDMFFAAGHYGQLLLVFPSQNLIVARAAHDAEYWSRIDAIAAKTLSCFAPRAGGTK